MADSVSTATIHILYRMYNQSGALLYVGMTLNPYGRFRGHRIDKPWWHEVDTIKLERFADRPAVLAAERRAISTEEPLYNLVHQPRADARPFDVCTGRRAGQTDQMNVRVERELRAQARAIARNRRETDATGTGVGAVVRQFLAEYVAEFKHLLPDDWQPPVDR